MNRRALKSGMIAAGMVFTLTACGGGSAPEPDPAPTPSPGPGELEISISPHSGSHATDVSVTARGFQPNARVGIGIGPPQSEYEILTHATADATGTIRTTVNVPDWTEPGRDYLFVARAPDGDDVISSEFRVTSGHDGGHEGGHTVRVTGRLTDEGVECPALRTAAGELYTLAGDTGDFGRGDRVEVEGTIAEMSICMQGTTISVERITAADGGGSEVD